MGRGCTGANSPSCCRLFNLACAVVPACGVAVATPPPAVAALPAAASRGRSPSGSGRPSSRDVRVRQRRARTAPHAQELVELLVALLRAQRAVDALPFP